MGFSVIDRIVFRLTHRRWNSLIFRVLCEHYGIRGGSARLTSEQLHSLAAEFDPTQNAAPWRGTLVARANTYHAPKTNEGAEPRP